LLRWKMTLKNYDCATHLRYFQERKWIPDCRKPGGKCKIGEHLATNREMNELVNKYLLFKRLPAVERDNRLGSRILKETGLSLHQDLLIRFEILYHELQSQEIENDRIKRKHQEIARRR
jgi:DNA-directed RNA polymerase subunit E'/Rpb7